MAALANTRSSSTIRRLTTVGPVRLHRPNRAEVDTALQSMVDNRPNYPHLGATDGQLPDGWRHDDDAIVLGPSEVWERAVSALRHWAQFDLSWVTPHDRDVPLEPEQLFAFTSRQLGVWAVNVCRVVYAVDEQQGSQRRFGFGYGTLGRHVVRGEEAFLLEQEAGVVRFRIRKFSRPAHPLVALAGPLAVRVQKRFTTDALQRMHAEVQP